MRAKDGLPVPVQKGIRCPAHPDAQPAPYLRGADDRFWGLADDFDYQRCPTCGALILDPRPEPSAIGRFYGGYYPETLLRWMRQRAQEGRPVGWAGRVRARGFLLRTERLGLPFNSSTKILDVGCGLGAFLGSIQRFSGAKGQGVDFSPDCAQFAREVQGVPVDVGELRAQNYPDQSYDYITAWHYLEHVYDPLAELKEMARLLKPGGVLMIETPTPDLLAALFRRSWLYLMPPTHLYHYRPDTLRSLMAQAGLNVLSVRRPWFPGELAGSIMLTAGVEGFVDKVFGPERRLGPMLALFGQMIYDIPITLSLALARRSGLLRVFAQKSA